MDIRDILSNEIAKGIVATGVEGAFDSVSCSTAGDYPSMGVSQWEGLNGGRGDQLLSWIDGGKQYMNRTYSDLKEAGEIPALKFLLGSEQGQAAQLAILSDDCKEYVDALQLVPTLDDTRCLIYAGIWCPTSIYVVTRFLHRLWAVYNLRSLEVLCKLFKERYYIAADVGDEYKLGYENRAVNTYNYVAAVDLTTPYGIPAYGQAGNGR